MNTQTNSSTAAATNPNTLFFRVAIDPAEAMETLEGWKLQKGDYLIIDPGKLIEVGHGYALMKIVGEVTAVQRHFKVNPEESAPILDGSAA